LILNRRFRQCAALRVGERGRVAGGPAVGVAFAAEFEEAHAGDRDFDGRELAEFGQSAVDDGAGGTAFPGDLAGAEAVHAVEAEDGVEADFARALAAISFK